MRQRIPMPAGSRYGSLVVTDPELVVARPAVGHQRYICVRVRCDCGIEHYVHTKNLRTGNTTSCGCRTRFKKKTA